MNGAIPAARIADYAAPPPCSFSAAVFARRAAAFLDSRDKPREGVVDTTAPTVACNAPATITPTAAPVSFTATAADVCDPHVAAQITAYDCWALTKKGKRIDKTESCVVTMHDGTVTIVDSGGVGDHVSWQVTATDASGNTGTATCTLEVVRPH